MNAIIEDGRGNRLVYKTSPLQQPRPKAASAEAPPPPRERTMIVPLEALNVAPREAAPQPAAVPQVPPPAPSRSSLWSYVLAAAIILAVVVMVVLS